MRLALLSPIHGQSIDHIARQLENYRTFLAPFELRHYLHISLDSSPLLGDHLRAFAEREQHSMLIAEATQLLKVVLREEVVNDVKHSRRVCSGL